MYESEFHGSLQRIDDLNDLKIAYRSLRRRAALLTIGAFGVGYVLARASDKNDDATATGQYDRYEQPDCSSCGSPKTVYREHDEWGAIECATCENIVHMGYYHGTDG